MTAKENISLFRLWLKSDESKSISFTFYKRCKSFMIEVNKQSDWLNLECWASSGTTYEDKTTYTIVISKP
jgi:hypothetical protein